MIKIGSRPSKLAVTQSNLFMSHLQRSAPEFDFAITEIRTTGDQKQSLSNVLRDKKDWIAELEEAIINSNVELALHSAKDIPYKISDKTIVFSVLPRATASDIFIGKMIDGKRLKFADLQNGAVIGTASLRRQAQLKLINKNFNTPELRGNVTSRIQKLDNSPDLQGIVLAAAGLSRLGMDLSHFEIFSEDRMLPAACQGILAAQISSDRQDLIDMIQKLVDPETQAQFLAERAFIRKLEADCHSAVSCYSTVKDGKIKIQAKIFGQKSLTMLSQGLEADIKQAESLGTELAEKFIDVGAQALLTE